MAYGDDFGNFEADVAAAAEREADAMDAMAEAEMAEEAEMNAAVGGIASGNRPGSGYGNDWGRSRTDKGIAGGRPGFDFADDASGGGVGGGLLADIAEDDYMGDYDYGGGLLDVGNQSGFTGGGMMDYSDMTGLTEDDLAAEWGTGSTKRDAGYDYTGDMNLAMAHAYDQRFSDPNHAWNTLTENEKRRVVTREQAGPSKIADIFNLDLDSRLNNLINSELDLRDPDDDRDDSAEIYRCEQAGGTWDGGSCVMPSEDPDDDDDNGDIDYGAFGKPNPFASLTRKRQMWYHPMLGGTGHGQVYDPYSGERPSHVDANLWDYMAPRGGAELPNWATALRKWGSGE